jgi:hypothetical protein
MGTACSRDLLSTTFQLLQSSSFYCSGREASFARDVASFCEEGMWLELWVLASHPIQLLSPNTWLWTLAYQPFSE